MTELAKAQQRTLEKMEPGEWYNTQNLGTNHTTMKILWRRGLVEREQNFNAPTSAPWLSAKYKLMEAS